MLAPAESSTMAVCGRECERAVVVTASANSCCRLVFVVRGEGVECESSSG